MLTTVSLFTIKVLSAGDIPLTFFEPKYGIISYSPFLVVEAQKSKRPRDMVVIMGGLRDTPRQFAHFSRQLHTLGKDVAFFSQRTEGSDFKGPTSTLASDFDSALDAIRDSYAPRSFTILGQSMAWGTVEDWRQHLAATSRSRELIRRIIFSNPALEFTGFIDPASLAQVIDIKSDNIGLQLSVSKRGRIHRIPIGKRSAQFVLDYYRWLENVRRAAHTQKGYSGIPITILAAHNDPNLDHSGIKGYFLDLLQHSVQADFHYVKIGNSRFAHNFWAMNGTAPARLLLRITEPPLVNLFRKPPQKTSDICLMNIRGLAQNPPMRRPAPYGTWEQTFKILAER